VLQRAAAAPGELGFARAYVAGELDVRGDILFALGELRKRVEQVRLTHYMVGAAVNFEAGRTQVHPVIAVCSDGGRSGVAFPTGLVGRWM
jgi:hypothetical protein